MTPCPELPKRFAMAQHSLMMLRHCTRRKIVRLHSIDAKAPLAHLRFRTCLCRSALLSAQTRTYFSLSSTRDGVHGVLADFVIRYIEIITTRVSGICCPETRLAQMEEDGKSKNRKKEEERDRAERHPRVQAAGKGRWGRPFFVKCTRPAKHRKQNEDHHTRLGDYSQ